MPCCCAVRRAALWTFSNADAAATDWVGDGHAAVRLITATDSLATAPALDAALEFRFGKGWHGYWRTPGDAGIAPAIDWSGSDNIAGGEVAWPAPHRLVIEGLQNSVYEKQSSSRSNCPSSTPAWRRESGR
jgi:suppressor for copper-sensitivity B